MKAEDLLEALVGSLVAIPIFILALIIFIFVILLIAVPFGLGIYFLIKAVIWIVTGGL